MFDLNFVINGKGTSLHKEIKYVNRSKSSFNDLKVQNILCVQLKRFYYYMFCIACSVTQTFCKDRAQYYASFHFHVSLTCRL